MRLSQTDVCFFLCYFERTSCGVGEARSITTSVDLGSSMVITSIAVEMAGVASSPWLPFNLRNSFFDVGLISLSILLASKSHEMPIICARSSFATSPQITYPILFAHDN